MKTVLTACLIVTLSAVTSLAQTKQTPETIVKTYGNATVAKIIAVESAYTFRCNVKDWPAVIGADISIKINGIAEPNIVAENEKPNLFFQMQAKKFLTAHLAKSKTITIENIKRGKDFSLIADVVTDSNSLAEILIENEFARKLTKEEIKANQNTPLPVRTTKQKPEAQAPGYSMNKQKPEARAPGRTTSASHYVASKNSQIFHESSCRFARSMDEKSALIFETKEQAIKSGRRQCKVCGK